MDKGTTSWSKSGIWQRTFEALAADADKARDAQERVIGPLFDAGKNIVIAPKLP